MLFQLTRLAFMLSMSKGGTLFGWAVEMDQKRVALLLRPQWVEMFWQSYELVVEQDVPELRSPNAWNHGRFRFRNLYFREAVLEAMPSVTEARLSRGQVHMRRLYLNLEDLRPVRKAFFQRLKEGEYDDSENPHRWTSPV